MYTITVQFLNILPHDNGNVKTVSLFLLQIMRLKCLKLNVFVSIKVSIYNQNQY